ncbi:antagonist of KipI [Paenibacillus sp. UNCCL117]|uniref:5-oxoprolinase subunit C family protein n=1 Tax=unclassified Paenibacillus TaxID=185978 RepID=UPI00087F5606|nr:MULTISPECIES: biotin-dependent carboxyltransferase family protein [unclassified Paenibacillus]SDE56044.1 antagonist of KipI [Paenibacillus sp. cl123]SFW66279.1 antagonist of KipI [Paenibacillus sp. UNCCL117]
MSIEVIRSGMLTTVQDLGRTGYQQYGVVVGGAMDSLSLRLANLLVGNEDGEAALEITLTGPVLQAQEDLLLAWCGGDFSPTVDGQAMPSYRPVLVRKGSVIRFGACRTGCRAYLAAAGGFDVPRLLGSRSTYLRGGFGGFEGRMLAAGDVLKCREPGQFSRRLMHRLADCPGEGRLLAAAPWFAGPLCPIPGGQGAVTVRALPGTDFDSLTAESRERLFTQPFEISTQSDRMGYRLNGERLKQAVHQEMLSEAVSPGTVQLPPEGQPIILLADRQTAGGYPRIAHIASADIPLLAQLRPGRRLYFREITLAQAERLHIRQELKLRELRLGIRLSSP